MNDGPVYELIKNFGISPPLHIFIINLLIDKSFSRAVDALWQKRG